MTKTGTEIKHATILVSQKIPQREHVGVGKIANMDVIAYGCPIRCGIICAKYLKVFEVPLKPHHCPRDQVRLVSPKFADLSVKAGAASIEITQGRPMQTVGATVIGQHPLDYKFGHTIRIDRIRRRLFANGLLIRRSINRT